MKAGRELNVLIATEIMGWVMHPSWNCLAPPGFPSAEEMWTPWEVIQDDEDGWEMSRKPIKGKVMSGVVMDGSGKPKLHDYSSSWDAARLVVEKLIEILPQGDIHIEHLDGEEWGISTCFDKNEGGWDGWVYAETFPLAICLAALKAMEEL